MCVSLSASMYLPTFPPVSIHVSIYVIIHVSIYVIIYVIIYAILYVSIYTILYVSIYVFRPRPLSRYPDLEIPTKFRTHCRPSVARNEPQLLDPGDSRRSTSVVVGSRRELFVGSDSCVSGKSFLSPVLCLTCECLSACVFV